MSRYGRYEERRPGAGYGPWLVIFLILLAATPPTVQATGAHHRLRQHPPATAKGQFGSFVRSIVTQESNGNYQARSPAGALGRYQILASNVPAWSREILGHPVTPQQFLDSPGLQDRIALGKLRQGYNRWGPTGAAAWWYSGDPGRAHDCSPVDSGPPVCVYVRQVTSRMRRYQAGGR